MSCIPCCNGFYNDDYYLSQPYKCCSKDGLRVVGREYERYRAGDVSIYFKKRERDVVIKGMRERERQRVVGK